MRPPGNTTNGITGTRTKAETNRVLTGTIKRLSRAAGLEPAPWQIRWMLATLRSELEEPTEPQIIATLMRAPWFPKPHIRRFQIGEAGWRVRS